MLKKAEFFGCSGSNQANREFLMEYQKNVLLALQEMGLLYSEEYEKCINILAARYCKDESHYK